MSDLELLSDEDAVASRNLLHSYGRLLSAHGTLHVTSKRIVFEPASRVDRAMGARRLSIALRGVEAVEYRGAVQPRLVIRTGRTEHVFLDRRRDDAFLEAAREAVRRLREGGAEASTGATASVESAGSDPLAPTAGAVLVLGDTDFYGTPLAEIVGNLDIEVRCVADADAAIEEYDRGLDSLSLVILNLLEHSMETGRVLEHVRSSGHAGEIPLWVIEPLFDKHEHAALDAASVDGYLDKSLEPNAVSDMINQLLRGGVTPDRRRHARVRAHFAAQIRCGDGSLDSYVHSIGQGGCFIETKQPWKLGSPVTVRFRLPDEDGTTEIDGEVVYMRPAHTEGPNPAGMGIKFRDLPPAASESIATYIREKLNYKVDEASVTLGL